MVRRIALVLGLAVVVGGCGDAARRPHVRTATSVNLPQLTGRPPAPLPLRSGVGHRPNIVFVLTDDLSTDLLRFMPHVRALERRGTTFTKYIVSDSLCCPSRASIFTGELPHDTHVFTNTKPDGGNYAFLHNGDEHRTFADALFHRGYRTALFGKYLNGYAANRGGIPLGWTDWSGTANGYHGFRYTLDEDGTPTFFGSQPQDYLTDVLGAQASQFIGTEQYDLTPTITAPHRPFFLEAATFAPHLPAIPAPRDAGRLPNVRAPRGPAFGLENRHAPPWLRQHAPLTAHQTQYIDAAYGRRARSVLAVDRMVGQLEAQLRASGDLQSTYFVFSSDNGFHMGQHRLLPGKKTAFDTDVRVPLIIAGPGVPAGARVSALTQNTDLAPTFEQLAGVPVPPTVDGRSLVPLLRGHRPRHWRAAALIEHKRTPFSFGDPDYQPFKAGNPPTYDALRLPGATYVQSVDGRREYYDDRRDPAQLDNRYATLTLARRRYLAALADRLKRCHGTAECANGRSGAHGSV
ncbi:MAG: N-acetylglucosamine-6-sulfatase [Solirubrobacteraceae bacterium]|jgi:arylsulfatase A-like enzyme|nr:N-acetylglucosamine-6-sulfatase [Solirubrobacteraceae bacterium]